jgi:murein DD-endopeptidase MepM/ murein hydrolase activator NlpD
MLVSLSLSAEVKSLKPIKLIGVLSQGSLVNGRVEQGIDVFLNGKAIKVTSSGDFVLGFGRDADLSQVLSFERSGKQVAEQTIVLHKRDYKIQRIEGVPQKMVTPNPSKFARIRADAMLVKTARKKNLEYEYFLAPFIPPSDGRITGVYGSQRVFNGTPKRPHYGLDYAGPVGTIVYAPASGVVTLTHDNMYYSGGTMIIDHGYGVSSSFLHLSAILVVEGDKIKQGDPIAKIGKGGRATGPHLDWRINWFNVRIDPQLVLDRYK